MTIADVALILGQSRDLGSWGLYTWARCVCWVARPAQGCRSGPFAAAVAALAAAGLGSSSAGRARPLPPGVSRWCFPEGG